MKHRPTEATINAFHQCQPFICNKHFIACVTKYDTTHEMEQICHPSHFPLLQGIYKQYYKSAFFRVKRHESIYKGHAMSPPCVLLVLNSPHYTTPLLARGISSTFNRYRKNIPLYHPPCFPHKIWVCLQFLCKML